jgi:hypothetical protein
VAAKKQATERYWLFLTHGKNFGEISESGQKQNAFVL